VFRGTKRPRHQLASCPPPLSDLLAFSPASGLFENRAGGTVDTSRSFSSFLFFFFFFCLFSFFLFCFFVPLFSSFFVLPFFSFSFFFPCSNASHFRWSLGCAALARVVFALPEPLPLPVPAGSSISGRGGGSRGLGPAAGPPKIVDPETELSVVWLRFWPPGPSRKAINRKKNKTAWCGPFPGSRIRVWAVGTIFHPIGSRSIGFRIHLRLPGRVALEIALRLGGRCPTRRGPRNQSPPPAQAG